MHEIEEFICQVSCIAHSSPTVQAACFGSILLFGVRPIDHFIFGVDYLIFDSAFDISYMSIMFHITVRATPQ